MTASHDVLCVGEHGGEVPWTDDERLSVLVEPLDALAEVVGRVDCVVVDGTLTDVDPADVVRSTLGAASDAPVVAVPDSGDALVFDTGGGVESVPVGRCGDGSGEAGDPPASEAGYADVASLVSDVAEAGGSPSGDGEASGTTGGGDGAYPAKLRALHDVAVDLVGCETEQEAFEQAITAAKDLLELLHSSIHVAEEGKLVPKAVTESGWKSVSEVETFEFDEGAVGHTYTTGESHLAEDVRDHELGEPTTPKIRSGITVALGEVGVLSAVSDRPGVFDEKDLALAEILAAHLTTAVQRIRSEAETRRERNRFRALFQNVPDAVVLVARDDDGSLHIRRANAAFERTFADDESVEGDALSDHVGVPDGESRTSFTDEAGVTVEAIRRETPDGARDFLFRGFPVDDSEPAGYYAIFTDITERRARKRELEQKSQRLEEFAGILSHDLRNPLQVAQGSVELLASEATDQQADHVERTVDALDRIDALIEDLLTVAREGWTVENRQPVEGHRAVERAWRVVDAPDATLECDWTDTVRANHDRLVEALENLFRNAVEHAGPDVTVRVEPLDDAAGVAVSDDGPGLPADVRGSLFERGVTGGRGTGLGLAVVDRIVDAHGWSVRATDSDAGGARFEIRFESAADDSARPSAEQ